MLPVELGLPVIGRVEIKHWKLGAPAPGRLRSLFGVDRRWGVYIGKGREALFVILPPGGWGIEKHVKNVKKWWSGRYPSLPDNRISHRLRWYSHATLIRDLDGEYYKPDMTFWLEWDAFWRRLAIVETGGFELVMRPCSRWSVGENRI